MKYNNSIKLSVIAVLLAGSQAIASDNDKTGTNPIIFSNDIRVYNEYQFLNTPSDSSQNITTAEFRTSFAEGKWQFRMKARFNNLDIDSNDNDFEESGFGDVDIRFLSIFSLNKESKTAWAGGLELFLNTASEDVLGSGTTSVGPQLFWVKFLPSGLFAPGIQYKRSIDEDKGRQEVDQILLDFNYLRMAGDKKSWFFTDPQVVFDRETEKEFMIVDFEFGWMMTSWFENLPGHSFYVRPSVGLGHDRPTDGSFEVGYKIVGW